MEGLSEFLHMGGYGPFVWPSYGLTAIVLILNAMLPRRAERRVLERLKRGVGT